MNEIKCPPISILTPAYDRRNFLSLMFCNISCFDYPKQLITWEILDTYSKDGKRAEPLFIDDNEVKTFEKQLNIKIKYTYLKKKMEIGEKRNYLSKNADNKIMINLDSDDLYFPSYLKYSLYLKYSKNVSLTGSNQMLFFNVKNNKFYAISCSTLRQMHEATFCYTKKWWRATGGYEKSSQGEGASMVDYMNPNKIANGNIDGMMCCIVHPNNTIDKEYIRQA